MNRSPGVEVLLEAPITFEVGHETTHAPMVRVTVGSIETKLILDTGSSHHVLTTALADAASLGYEPGEAGTDSVGASVASWTIGDVSIAIAARSLELHETVAITGPPPFAGWGVGGFLSPQHLHPSAYAVLDLAGQRLSLADAEPGALASWLQERFLALRVLSLERELGGEGELLVRGAIEPFDEVITLLDTGGKRTEFAEDAVPGLRGGVEQRTGRGVGGGDAIGREVGPLELRIGGGRVQVPSLLIRREMGEGHGLIGMDVLRGTVVAACGDAERPAFWMVPRRYNRAGVVPDPQRVDR
jgi:hypothetical protein